MKLSTLLLSSAAFVVAGSAYAADLPAKKGAPAAKAAAGCPAFGAGFFQIPGGDNCIKFSGKVYSDTTFAASSTTTAGTFDLYFDVRSNSDVGVVRGFAGMSAGSLVDKAYVQFGGLTAGKRDAVSKVFGGPGGNFGGASYGNPSDSISYDMSMGSSTLSVGLQNPGSHTSQTTVTKQPDIAAALSVAAGAATVKVAGVAHEAVDQSTGSKSNGYAALGSAAFNAGSVSILGWAGYANGATSYINSANQTGYVERASNNNLTGSAYGVQSTVAMGQATLGLMYTNATIQAASSSYVKTGYNAWVSYAVAKNLTITPEFWTYTDDVASSKTTTNAAYIRIARDF